ncbi:hypothetical protein L4C36_07155 [Photobacterium japonica]|uniref:hypothetical protein n=1 Tax=Photobacterium japonica TaxID=2910235 RepID=UPI003D146A5A
MDVVLAIFVFMFFTVLSIKLAAKLLDVDSPGAGLCVLATILSAVVSAVLIVFSGAGVIAAVVSFFVTGAVYTFVFGVNAIVGFVLAGVSMAVQMAFIIAAVMVLGFSLGGLEQLV